jgi:hypothetical protein
MIQIVIYFQQCYLKKTNQLHKCLNTTNENLPTQMRGHVMIKQCSCTLHSILLTSQTSKDHKHKFHNTSVGSWYSQAMFIHIACNNLSFTCQYHFDLSWQITLHNNLFSSQWHDIPFRLWIQGSDDTHIKDQMLRIYHLPKCPKTLLALTNEVLLFYIWLIHFKA